jgi:hypothetical protein
MGPETHRRAVGKRARWLHEGNELADARVQGTGARSLGAAQIGARLLALWLRNRLSRPAPALSDVPERRSLGRATVVWLGGVCRGAWLV